MAEQVGFIWIQILHICIWWSNYEIWDNPCTSQLQRSSSSSSSSSRIQVAGSQLTHSSLILPQCFQRSSSLVT